MSTYMKYMLPMGFFAVTFCCEEVSKFAVEMRFFIVFDNIAASLHRNPKRWASERTLSYATLQCVGILLTLDINMTKSHFNLLQYIYSSTLIFRNSRDKHLILKDNSWICIYHQYHKVSRLKSCTAREKWGKYTRKIYFIISRWRSPSRSCFFLLGLLLP